MPFLTRWDDDHSRPKFTSALRDVLVRAVLPAIAIFVGVVAVGFLLKGPLASFGKWENGVSKSFEDGRTETWNTITKFMSMIGNTEYVIAVGVIVCAIVWWRTKEWWFAVVPLIAISLQATVFVIAAAVVSRDRPPVERLDPTPPTSSYPSGHVGASTALYVSFALMATRIQNVVVRRLVIVVCILAPLLVSYARLYRGAHHISDILIGMLNGLLCALLAWNYLRREPASGTASSGSGARDGSTDETAQTRA
jgi:membrane-associated phospholipid phosphatase